MKVSNGVTKADRTVSAVASGVSVVGLRANGVGQGSEAEVGNQVHIGIMLPFREMVGKGDTYGG